MAGWISTLLVHGFFLSWLWTGQAPEPGLPAVALGTETAPLRWIKLDGGDEGSPPAVEVAPPSGPSSSVREVPRPATRILARERVEIDQRPIVGRADGAPLASALASRLSSPVASRGSPAGGGSAPAGEGEGGSDGSSEGAYTPPRARSVLHTWSPHRAVMGLEVLVRVRLDERGRPTGIVELLPPTPHRDTNEQLVYWTRNVEYHPALIDGRPVAGWAEVSYRFCYEGTTATSPPSPTFGRPDPCAVEEVPARRVAVRRSGT